MQVTWYPSASYSQFHPVVRRMLGLPTSPLRPPADPPSLDAAETDTDPPTLVATAASADDGVMMVSEHPTMAAADAVSAAAAAAGGETIESAAERSAEILLFCRVQHPSKGPYMFCGRLEQVSVDWEKAGGRGEVVFELQVCPPNLSFGSILACRSSKCDVLKLRESSP